MESELKENISNLRTAMNTMYSEIKRCQTYITILDQKIGAIEEFIKYDLDKCMQINAKQIYNHNFNCHNCEYHKKKLSERESWCRNCLRDGIRTKHSFIIRDLS